jgi:hypothetical protein
MSGNPVNTLGGVVGENVIPRVKFNKGGQHKASSFTKTLVEAEVLHCEANSEIVSLLQTHYIECSVWSTR